MIFRYPGGKSRPQARAAILARFPESYSEYREPMVGGGGIFFAVPTDKRRWVNDMYAELISVYRALAERPGEFIGLCKAIPSGKADTEMAPARPGGRAIYSARLKRHFDEFAENADCDQALRWLFIHRTVWAGRVLYERKSRMYFSNPTGWNIVDTDKLERAAAVLRDVRVTSGDYLPLLEEGGEGVLVYLDPPYQVNTELSESDKLYRHNFTREDHEKLCDRVKACKHKVVMSYDDDDFIRGLYRGFNLHQAQWAYCGTSKKKKDRGQELVITNF